MHAHESFGPPGQTLDLLQKQFFHLMQLSLLLSLLSDIKEYYIYLAALRQE